MIAPDFDFVGLMKALFVLGLLAGVVFGVPLFFLVTWIFRHLSWQ